ncbi:MAG: hypothetical protein IT245_08720 [Bacteroidia bacterium]|nr:hypothetical protein [Bacteroidia bacterium]
MFKRILTILIFGGLFLLESAAQCPMCKASVESSQSTNTKSVGMGLNAGILMLMGAVYVILFSVGILWYKKYRKTQNEYAG